MCSAWTEIRPEIKHKVFTQEAGAGGVRVGWLELEQSNSASFENESLKTLTGAFCHRWRKSARGAAAAGGSGQGSIRSLRHLCWRFPQGPGSAGSREPQRAENCQELGIAGGGQKFRGRRGQEQPAAAWRRSRHAYSGVLTQEARETGSAWKAEAQRVAEASRGAIHHRGSSNICARICLFSHFALAILLPRMNASAYDPQSPNRPSSRETPDEERRRTVLLVSGKAHPLNSSWFARIASGPDYTQSRMDTAAETRV